MWGLPGHLGTDGGGGGVSLRDTHHPGKVTLQSPTMLGQCHDLVLDGQTGQQCDLHHPKGRAPQACAPCRSGGPGPCPGLKFHGRWRKVSCTVWLLGRAPAHRVTVYKAVRCQHLCLLLGQVPQGFGRLLLTSSSPPPLPPASHVFPKIEDLRDFHLSFSVWFSGLSLS